MSSPQEGLLQINCAVNWLIEEQRAVNGEVAALIMKQEH